jgi:hypothetical protein
MDIAPTPLPSLWSTSPSLACPHHCSTMQTSPPTALPPLGPPLPCTARDSRILQLKRLPAHTPLPSTYHSSTLWSTSPFFTIPQCTFTPDTPTPAHQHPTTYHSSTLWSTLWLLSKHFLMNTWVPRYLVSCILDVKPTALDPLVHLSLSSIL